MDSFRTHWMLLLVLVAAAIIWAWVFSFAMNEFVSGTRPFRAAWNGEGEISLFGYTLEVHFEGFADYDYYYVTWGEQFLSGYVPYTDVFDNLVIGSDEWYTPFFFPPLYVYICALGNSLPFQPVGIALLICSFGFLTALPIYGISTYLSGRRDIGAVSAATYLFNPLILYHTVVQWLNPAPFVFFAMTSLFLLMRGHRYLGLLSMVTAALFKQTAFFLAFPLIAFLIKRPPRQHIEDDPHDADEDKKKVLPSDRVDLPGLLKMIIVAGIYAVIVSFPYLLDFENYAFNIFQRAGSTFIEDFINPPANNVPISMAVPFIVLGAPEWLSQALNAFSFYSLGILVGILAFFGLMLFEVKDDSNLEGYWRRVLYLTLLLMLWLHIWSPRGVYKYYFVALIPFFSILSVSRMCSRSQKKIDFSFMMIIVPLIFSLLILIPHRNVYLLGVAFIAIAYIVQRPLGKIYGRLKSLTGTDCTPIQTRAQPIRDYD
jgi:hypothetical protein